MSSGDWKMRESERAVCHHPSPPNKPTMKRAHGHGYYRRQCLAMTLIMLCPVSSFIASSSFLQIRRSSQLLADILDVDFVRDGDDARPGRHDSLLEEKPKNLFDLSLEADPDFLEARIPFIDNDSANSNGVSCIDVKLAFMAALGKVQYGIGIPFDSVVALTLEKEDGSVQYLSPDLDENEELMEIMAGQLREQLGEDFRLMRTPRVLTIRGPLDEYTKDWKTKLLPKPVGIQDLMGNDDDDDLASFHKFMKEELGEEEYQKTLDEDPDDEEMKELLKLFEMPGLGDQIGDNENVEDLLTSLLNPDEDFNRAKESLGVTNVDHEGVAIKLISYMFAGGKSYSLVKLLNPYAIVGKYIEDDTGARFELLTPSEEKIVLPRLEQACRKDLESAGLKL